MIGTLLLAASLLQRLHPIIPPGFEADAMIYDRYRSGRPRRVIATIGRGNFIDSEGEILLVRLPDSDSGAPVVSDREKLESHATGLSFVKLVDPKDIVVDLPGRHQDFAIVYRVRHDHPVQIADEFWRAVDLDGDGIPEIIATMYRGQNECEDFAPGVAVLRWDGQRYVGDGREYAGFAFRDGKEDDLALSSTKRYVVHLYLGAKATIDGTPVPAGKPLAFDDGCHAFGISGRGWAFLEEVDAPVR